MSTKKYSIQELAKLTDLSRRTIRYYIQRGLLQAPLGSGRGSYYDEVHLSRLLEIRDRQLRGIPLSEMNSSTEPSPKQVALPMEQWTRVIVAKGVEIHLCNHQLSDTQIETIRHTISILLPFTKESS